MFLIWYSRIFPDNPGEIFVWKVSAYYMFSKTSSVYRPEAHSQSEIKDELPTQVKILVILHVDIKP